MEEGAAGVEEGAAEVKEEAPEKKEPEPEAKKEEEEIDPLDAFMLGVNAEVKKTLGKPAAAKVRTSHSHP